VADGPVIKATISQLMVRGPFAVSIVFVVNLPKSADQSTAFHGRFMPHSAADTRKPLVAAVLGPEHICHMKQVQHPNLSNNSDPKMKVFHKTFQINETKSGIFKNE
jgi:hypothetical protein